MKKWIFFLGLLPLLAVTGFAQESRQDISMSFLGTFQPKVTGNAITQTSTIGIGDLIEYRFMLNPSNALEANYSYSQFTQKYISSGGGSPTARIHTRYEEFSAEYVRSFTFKRFNPFVGVGAGEFFYRPIDDTHTTTNKAGGSSSIEEILGGGIAYEVSPSWDLRVEYRGTLTKASSFGLPNYNTNRYYIIQQPAIGIAYHF